jgi:hypothetical protein
MPKKKTLTRIERAQRLYEHARMEIAYVRDLDAALRDEGKALTPYLKQQAVDIARFLVRSDVAHSQPRPSSLAQRANAAHVRDDARRQAGSYRPRPARDGDVHGLRARGAARCTPALSRLASGGRC